MTDEALRDPGQDGQGMLLGSGFMPEQTTPNGHVEAQPGMMNHAPEELSRQGARYHHTRVDLGGDKDKGKSKSKSTSKSKGKTKDKEREEREDKRKSHEEHKHKKSSREMTIVSNRGNLPQASPSVSVAVETRATGSTAVSKRRRSSKASMSSMNETSDPAPMAMPALAISTSGASSPEWSAYQLSTFPPSAGTAMSATASSPDHECLLASPVLASPLPINTPDSSRSSAAPTTTITATDQSIGATSSRSSKRARNRLAATKCRAKTKSAITKLEADERALSSRHELLTEEKAQLRDEIYVLKEMLLAHSGCNCILIREYLANTARSVVEPRADGAVFGPGLGLGLGFTGAP